MQYSRSLYTHALSIYLSIKHSHIYLFTLHPQHIEPPAKEETQKKRKEKKNQKKDKTNKQKKNKTEIPSKLAKKKTGK